MNKSPKTIQDQVLITIAILAATYGISLGIYVFFTGNYLVGTVDVATGCLFGVLAILTIRKPGQKYQRLLIIFAAICFFYFMFTSGGQNQTGYIWSIIVPSTTAFFLGTRAGIIIPGIYLLILFATYFFGPSLLPGGTLLAPQMFFRFAGAYLIVHIVAVVYEYNRARNVKRYEQEIILRKKIAAEKSLAESALHQAKTLIEIVNNSIPQLVLWKDVNLKYLGCNQQAVIFFNLPNATAITGLTDEDLPWHNQGLAAINKADLAVIEKQEALLHCLEQRQLHDGSWRWFDVCRVPMLNSAKILTGLLITLEDVTERKLLEEKAAKAHEATITINRLMVDREERIIELKKQVNQLSRELSRPAVYPSVEPNDESK